jgi:hypothetical protein
MGSQLSASNYQQAGRRENTEWSRKPSPSSLLPLFFYVLA